MTLHDFLDSPQLVVTTSLIIGLLWSLYPAYRHIRIVLWKRAFSLKQHQRIFDTCYEAINGFFLSQQARRTGDAMEYLYGEIDFVAFTALLALTKPNAHSVFYDLGSGVGKAVVTCAMVFEVHKSIGIELFAPLHQAAISVKNALAALPEYHEKAHNIHLIHANFLTIDLHEATHLFINATAFFGETWQALNKQLETQAQQATIITTSKPLCSKKFKILKKTTVLMSWGAVTAFIQIGVS